MLLFSSCATDTLARQARTISGPGRDAPILTSTLVITSADNGKTFSDYRISTTSGECISIIGASDVTIESSNIGPCGDDRSTHASNGIHISDSTGINIYDSYIHVENQASACCDTHDGVLVDKGSRGVNIQGNVIAYSESNIEVGGKEGAIHDVSVIGNYLLNPLGPFPRAQNFQSWSGHAHNSSITVSNNYAFSCVIRGGPSGVECPLNGPTYLHSEAQEDSINFGYTDNITVQDNWIEGGHSRTGCGIIMDDAANGGYIQHNVLYEMGQCGVGLAGGMNHIVDGNRILSRRAPYNVGIYVWNQYREPRGSITVSNNISSVLAPSSAGCNPDAETCTYNGYWNHGNWGATTESGNTFDMGTYGPGGGPAYQALNPITFTNPPPMIPPQPKRCVAKSPYSTQTSAPGCS
jgi:hypothetical protein